MFSWKRLIPTVILRQNQELLTINLKPGMKSLLLILVLVSFIIYKAELNEKTLDDIQTTSKTGFLNTSKKKEMIAAFVDSTKTAVLEKQLKNKS
jgi:hypothetical protein